MKNLIFCYIYFSPKNIFFGPLKIFSSVIFRDTQLSFKVTEQAEKEIVKRNARYCYPSFKKKMGNFELTVEGGEFTDSEIIVMLGENGTGKTTLIRFSYQSICFFLFQKLLSYYNLIFFQSICFFLDLI